MAQPYFDFEAIYNMRNLVWFGLSIPRSVAYVIHRV
jgi:hypothetical protein